MQHLDKERVPYGILYDRVFPYARLADTVSSDTTSLANFMQAYSEWQRADYNFEHNDTIFDHTTVANFVYGQNELDTIPIFVFNADFASIDSAAFTDGRIDTIAGLMYDGENAGLPYQTHHELFAVLGLNRVPDSGKTYYFVFDPAYEFGNHPYHVTEVKLKDLSSGEEYSFTPGGTRGVAITLTGEGSRSFKLTTTIEEAGHPDVINTNLVPELWKPTYVAGGNCRTEGSYTSWLGFQGYDENTTRNGKFNYRIYYGKLPDGTCRGYLAKPIIITDGYDVGDETTIDKIYDEYLVYDYNYSKQKLGEQLRALGYDIIIINFPNEIIGWEQKVRLRGGSLPVIETTPVFWDHGCDYIERNGLAVACFIDYVNGMLLENDVHDEQLVVVGPSMGGQVTRYALKYMEDHNWDHNTRLWISFDSPHLGANIPFGFQEMIRYMAQELEIDQAKEMYSGNLRSPVARQMLIRQSNPTLYPFTPPYISPAAAYYNSRFSFADNNAPERIQWMNTLNTIGFPNNLRKIAIANGRYSGGEFHIGGNKMFSMKSTSIKNGIKAFQASPYLATTQVQKWVEFWKWGSGNLYTLNGKLNSTFGAIDACPGGMYDVQQVFHTVVDGSVSSVKGGHPIFHKVRNTVEDMSHNISFIPTVSALSLASHNWPWVNPFNPQSVNCNYECPFDNIYVPEYNEPHVSLTDKSAWWVIQEILDSQYPYSCPRVCISEITGDTYLPMYSTKTYGLNGSIPGSTTATWSLGSDLSPSSTSGSSINITRIANTGHDEINVHVDNNCSADAYLYKKLSATPKPGRDEENPIAPGELTTPNKEIIYIYPNPATDYWNIDILQQAQNISASLTDISGRQVWSSNSTATHNFHIRSGGFAPGLYTLRLNIDGKETFHKLTR